MTETTAPAPPKKKKTWFEYFNAYIGILALTYLALELARRYLPRPWRTVSESPLLPALLLIGVVVVLLLWKIPVWQVERSNGLSDETRFDRENEARKTLAQVLGGVFLLAGLYSSVQTLNLSREGQITDRFTKAIEQLGAQDEKGKSKIVVRLGGVYALERIARESRNDHSVIVEVLTTYIRHYSPLGKQDGQQEPDKPESGQLTGVDTQDAAQHPSADIEAILSVLGRRRTEYDATPLNLSSTELRGANLSGAYLDGAHLEGTDLSGANLEGAHLDGAQLEKADLDGANLIGAHLRGARLNGASLNKADLNSARLEEAQIVGAHLSGAVLFGAHLNGANLYMAHMSGANLSIADLGKAEFGRADLSKAIFNITHVDGADFFGADLSGAQFLTQAQINSALGDPLTLLPPNLKKPSRLRKK